MDDAEQSAGRPILYEVRGEAAWIRFNRPEVMNAFHQACHELIQAAIARASADDAVRAVVFIGEGGRAFSTGGDLKYRAEREAARDSRNLSYDTFAAVGACAKPTIAAIDGYAVGGGLEVALMCDIRIATEASRLGLPEVRRSMMPFPGLLELQRLIPMGEALKMQLTGLPMGAGRAFQIGLVQELLPDREALIAAAARLVDEIAQGAPMAVEAYKRVARESRELSREDGVALRARLWEVIEASEDRAEARAAWAEKRPPVWRRR